MMKKNAIPSKLNNIQKAAVLIISLGPQGAAKIFKELNDEEIEKVSVEISRLKHISREARVSVFEEAYQMSLANDCLAKGGEGYARLVLEQALGPEKASEVIEKVRYAIGKGGPFEILDKIDTNQICSFLQQEQPQTIALILAHLEPKKSAEILSMLPEDMQTEVSIRIATMSRTTPEVIDQIERVIKDKLAGTFNTNLSSIGGAKSVAEVLNYVDRSTEKNILETLEERENALAEEIKKLMFVFEDIVHVEDRSMQKVLKEIDTNEISVALKAASEEVKSKIFKNISSRAAQMIQEELDYMGPIKLKVVEEAQQKIVNVVRRLEEEGEIVISGRGGTDDELIV
ncbi:MAG: flagellar motor switch protein FliG [Candidatus Auribacterota bacterium]|nr:flagellar motor switch protein FliG [Candidatus Auribacterota bacterium]